MKYDRLGGGLLRSMLSIGGFVKVGGKDQKNVRWRRAPSPGPYLLPTRYINPVRFRVTTRERTVEEIIHPKDRSKRKFKLDRGYSRDDAIHQKVGDKPNSLKVRLYFPKPDQNLVTHLGYHNGKIWACTGDGERATEVDAKGIEMDRACPCPRLRRPGADVTDPTAGTCKPRGVLTVWLEASEQFGVAHLFKTTSWESIAKLKTQLDIFYKMFGTLAWLPLRLRVDPSEKVYQDNKGITRRSVQPVVTLAVDGSPEAAAAAALNWHESQHQAKSIADPEVHRKLLEEDMQRETISEGEEFFPAAGRAPEQDGPPPERAADRLAQLTRGT